MIRTNDYSKALAALFAVVMLLSMVAPSVGAAVAADAGDVTAEMEAPGDAPALSGDVSYEQMSDRAYDQQDTDDVEIDPALERKFEDGGASESGDDDGTVDVVVRLSSADTSDVQGRTATIKALKSHAAETQESVVRFAGSTEYVDLERQFWITNAVLLEVNPDRISLEEIASAEGVEQLHANFEVTTAQASGGNGSADGSTNQTASENETSTDETASDDSAESEDASADTEPAVPSSMQPEDYDTTYGLEMVNATEVWDTYNTQGDGVEVAVLDTGMDDSHPDLPELDDEHWQSWDSDGNPIDSEPSDSDGHGTHVSGTVAGAEDPAGDVPTYGVAPDVELYHGQVIPGGSGSFTQVAAGMEWAVEQDVDIISMSLGAGGYFTEMIDPSENARDAGVILVASAGNGGPGTSGSPGNVYPNFASGAVNEDADVAGFSGGETVDTSSAWGSDAPGYWPDEYVVPDAAAPGVDVLSSVPGGGYSDAYSGTSMSAPHKTGVFALMLSAAGGSVDRETAIETIEDTAWKPDDAPEPPGTPDTRYGNGIVDAKAAADQVALDSGVTGTVTDSAGDAVEGATVEVEETGFAAETGADGEYTVLSPPGNYTVTSGGFGYEETSVNVSIPDNETFVSQNITLADALGVQPVAGQPEAIEGGQQFEVQVNVANLETYSVERNGTYEGDLTLELNGDEIPEGEDVDVGDVTGIATLTVTTEANTEGELELDHTFSGAGDTVSVTTGPTNVFSEFTPIAVVDDGDYGQDVVDRLTAELPASYEISLITGSEAVDASADDEYEAYIVQNIDQTYVQDLKSNTAGPGTGVVWLDQWGSYSNGIPARSSVLGDPASTSDSLAAGAEMEIAADSPLFEGVGDVGDTFPLYSGSIIDHSWFGDTSFETVGYVQSGAVTDGGGAATNAQEREVLLSSFGNSFFVGGGAHSDAADAVLANAAEWATVTPPAYLNEGQPVQDAPGDRFGAEYTVDQLEQIKVSLHEDSTANQSNLDLYVGGTINAWDEYRAYPDPVTDDDYTVEVESDEDTVGSVILETTFVFANSPDAVGDGADIAPQDSHTVNITTGPTAVYDKPLTVGDGEDVETIQEAVNLAPDGAEIVVTEGTYPETVSVDETQNLTITGEDATIVAPDSSTDDGHAHVDIQASGTHFEGFDLETPAALAGVGVSGASDVHIADVSVTGASDAVQVVESSDVTVTNASATGAAANGVHVAGSDAVDVHDAEVTDAGTGVRIADSADVTVDAPTATNVSYGVMLDGATDVGVADASVEDAAEAGVASMSSSAVDIADASVEDAGGAGVALTSTSGVDLTDATVTGAEYGIRVDGGAVSNLTDAAVSDSKYGIAAEGGATVSYAAHNEITNATTGFVFSGGMTSGEFAMNDVNATTGVLADDAGGDITFHFNDLVETETAMAAESGTFSAPLNWFGIGGPQVNNGAGEDVDYSPYLTADVGEVDLNTTQIAVDLTMEANETYTVGIPAATDQTVGDAFADEFEGAIYGYDAEIGDWQMLTANDSLSALSAVLVVTEEETHATLDFQSGDGPASPGQVDLHNGWNLVSPSAYHDAERAFWTDGTNKGDGDYYTPSTWMVAESHADRHIGQGEVGDDAVNPFGGYWVGIGAEGDGYTLFSEMQQDPSIDDYRAMLNPETPTAPQPPGEGPGDGPSEPEDVSVAVVDAQNYHEGDLENVLSERLDDDVYTTVDTLTADELLGEMDGYDVFVVQRFGSDSLASDFIDALDDDQAVVYLDSRQGATSEAYADGILRLQNVREDPAERDSVSLDADGEPVEVDIESDHPIFDGVGEEGESVPVVDSDITWGSWFNDYDGQVLGHADFSPSDDGQYEGPGVAIDEDRNEVLNTAIAMDFFHDEPDFFTEEGATLFANSVREAASMAASSSGDAVEEEEEETGTQPSVAAGPTPAAA